MREARSSWPNLILIFYKNAMNVSSKTKVKPLPKGKSSGTFKNKDLALKRKLASLFHKWMGIDRLRWIILAALSLFVAVLLFPNILTRPPVYNLGDIAERDIKASHDFLIENTALTEKNRENAARKVLGVYDFDNIALNLVPAIRKSFSMGREYLKTISANSTDQEVRADLSSTEVVKNRFFATLEIPPNERLFAKLLKSGFPAEVEDATIGLLGKISRLGIVGNMSILKKQFEKGGIILHDINTRKETRVTNPERFFDLKGARDFIKRQKKDLEQNLQNPKLSSIVIDLAQSLIRPNLTFNQRETELRKEVAQESVKPVYFKIKKGEMLVREGERIGPQHLLRLSGEIKSQKPIERIGRVPAMALLIGLFILVIQLVGIRSTPLFLKDGRNFVFNTLTLFTIFVFFWAYGFVAEEVARGFTHLSSKALLFAMPVASGAMLISVFQGTLMGVTFSLVISVLASLVAGGRVEFFIFFFTTSVVAAYGVRSCRERGVFIKTGLVVGLIGMILAPAVKMVNGSIYSVESVVASASGFTGGLLCGVIVTGILPLIEMAFGFTTDIKLLELGNLDQPLLRELMVQAPGTYHHSVIISNMVEATAKAVHANPLLAKVSAYYHDIGKMKKPLYFIENQMGTENKHEKLAPSMSSLILISHVKDGVELAAKYKLGREISDIIQQHHGTSLISYFYQKAKDRMVSKGGKPVEINQEDFRYPGPKPQTKEAGLVMLADMVEAASRTLSDPTPARIQGLVQKIINKAFSDGQLDECELSLKDLHEIAKGFNKTLSGIFHHRIEYPEAAQKTSKKAKNENTGSFGTEDSGPEKPEDSAEVNKSLKRLGL